MLQSSFARPVGLFDNWFNRFVSFVTQGSFCHSEFIFSWDMDTASKFFEGVEGYESLKTQYLEHVEDGKVNICFYVVWGDVCSYRLLKHTNRTAFYRMPNEVEHKVVELNVGENDEFQLAKFLLSQCGKNYDYSGALASFIPLRRSSTVYDSYFCSQYMVCGLQHIGRFGNVNPSGVTPNSLYRMLLTTRDV